VKKPVGTDEPFRGKVVGSNPAGPTIFAPKKKPRDNAHFFREAKGHERLSLEVEIEPLRP